MYANIIPLTKLPLSKPQVYTYDVSDFAKKIKIGQIVEAPLYNRNALGIVKEILTQRPEVDFKFKNINKIIDDYPIINGHDLNVADFISQYYFSSLGLILKHLTPEIPKRQTKNFLNELAKINLNIIDGCSNKNFNSNSEKAVVIKNNQTTPSPSLSKEVNDRGNALIKEDYNRNVLIKIGSKLERQSEYLKIIKQNLKQKKQTLILVPEISLIPQTYNWLKENLLNEEIILLQSGENKTNTLLNWRKAQTSSAKIFLGTRKAIFTSFYNLATIIIDEEPDLSYKQWDMNPRYDTRKVAEIKAKLYNCDLVLGALTPSINIYNKIKPEFKKISHQGQIIDMRNEMRKGNFTIFSENVENQINENLINKKQSVLFINRRASSTFVMCRDCGNVLRCPKCKIALMEHTNKTLSCNHCNFKTPSPSTCPKCNSHKIKGFGAGVEKVEQAVREKFPNAKVARFDNSTPRLRDIEIKIKKFENNEIDIIVGTQIALNLTSVNLNLLVAIAIDPILNFPDWMTDEKSWHLVNKIMLSKYPSIIQTYTPEHKILQLAYQNNFDEFYQQELINRQALNYPPFAQLVKLTCKSDDYELMQVESNRVAMEIKKVLPVQNIIGPINPINPKIRNFWQKQIIIKLDKNKNQLEIKKILQNLNNLWSIDIDSLT